MCIFGKAANSHHQHTSCSAVLIFQLTAEQTAAAEEKDAREATGGAPPRSNTQSQSRFKFHQFNQSSFHWVFWEVFAIVSFNNLEAGRRSACLVVSAATVCEGGTKFLSVVTQVQDHRPKDSQSREKVAAARHNFQDTHEVLLCESVSGQ